MAKKLYYKNKEIYEINNGSKNGNTEYNTGVTTQKSGFFIAPFETSSTSASGGTLSITLKDNNGIEINQIPEGSVFFYKATNVGNTNYSTIKIGTYILKCPNISHSGSITYSNIKKLYPNEIYCLWFTGNDFKIVNPINFIHSSRQGFDTNSYSSSNTAYTIEQRLAQIEAYLNGDNTVYTASTVYTALHPHNNWTSSSKMDTKDPKYGAPSFVASQDKLTASNITSTGNPNISTTPDGSLIGASDVPDANVFIRTFVDTNGVNFRGN